MKIFWIGVIGNVIFLLSCGSVSYEEDQPKETFSKELIQAVLWHQNSGERKAICYQAFNLATLRLKEYINTREDGSNPAIIVDIDETILDNSPYEGKVIKKNSSYPDYWKEWVESASAEALPGALNFMNFAASNDVEIFYVSNRKEHGRKFTKKNLTALGFPNVDDAHLYLREKKSYKESIRRLLGVDHDIILLIGDNLDDFSSVFEHRTVEERKAAVDSLWDEFGNRFIVLPNAMYGDWEFSMYGYESRSYEEKRSIRDQHIKDFDEL